jgi:hypothetical protein
VCLVANGAEQKAPENPETNSLDITHDEKRQEKHRIHQLFSSLLVRLDAVEDGIDARGKLLLLARLDFSVGRVVFFLTAALPVISNPKFREVREK